MEGIGGEVLALVPQGEQARDVIDRFIFPGS